MAVRNMRSGHDHEGVVRKSESRHFSLSSAALEGKPAAVPHIKGLNLPPSGHRVFCGDIDMRIDAQGTWLYKGSPITRKDMVCLFASTLQRDSEGHYWMVTPHELAAIQVDDVPFLGVELYVEGCGPSQILTLRTNVDEMVTIDQAHPLEMRNSPISRTPAPYVTVRPGLAARLTRAVYFELVALGEECQYGDTPVFGVYSRGDFFLLGSLAE